MMLPQLVLWPVCGGFSTHSSSCLAHVCSASLCDLLSSVLCCYFHTAMLKSVGVSIWSWIGGYLLGFSGIHNTFCVSKDFFFFFFNLLLFCLLPSHVGFYYLSVHFILPLSPEILSYHPSVSLSRARYGSAIADWQRERVSYSDGVRLSLKASADCRLVCCQLNLKTFG